MINLERIERAILIFLVAALIVGVAVSALRKSRAPVKVTVEKFDPLKYADTAEDAVMDAREKVNINTAGVEEFAAIKGIGAKRAARIVEYRYRNGSFASIDDIKNVKGVGVALFEKIRNKITVE